MTRTALVTGANQGIGFALVEGLAARLDPDDLVLLTGRNAQRVADATASVSGARARVEGRVLDVRDTAAIARLADELGGADIVLSNAIAPHTPDRPEEEQADEFIDVSNVATHAILRSFGPVLRPGGRLIVVASSLGTLEHLDPDLHALFDGVTLDEVEQAVEAWRAAIHNGTAKAQRWPDWINVPSKVAQVAAVRAYAAQHRDRGKGTLIASVCPGLVDTRASRPWYDDFSYALTPAESARRVLDFVLSDQVDPATYGELVRFGKILPWLPKVCRSSRPTNPLDDHR